MTTNCDHQCTGNCRREGCHCACEGEFHESDNKVITTEQEAIIEKLKSTDHD